MYFSYSNSYSSKHISYVWTGTHDWWSCFLLGYFLQLKYLQCVFWKKCQSLYLTTTTNGKLPQFAFNSCTRRITALIIWKTICYFTTYVDLAKQNFKKFMMPSKVYENFCLSSRLLCIFLRTGKMPYIIPLDTYVI